MTYGVIWSYGNVFSLRLCSALCNKFSAVFCIYAKTGHRPIKSRREKPHTKSHFETRWESKVNGVRAIRCQNGDMTRWQKWQKQQRTQNARLKQSLAKAARSYKFLVSSNLVRPAKVDCRKQTDSVKNMQLGLPLSRFWANWTFFKSTGKTDLAMPLLWPRTLHRWLPCVALVRHCSIDHSPDLSTHAAKTLVHAFIL